ncbi:TPA: DNA-binding response regulator [Elizabethkingia anophelis]
METGTAQQKNTIGFINEKSPILDLICDDLTASGFEIAFRSETIEDGLFQLASLKELPIVCIIDLDFYDKQILSKLQKLRAEYPTIKMIAHSDIDDEKVGNTLLNIGFSSCLLVGSDVNDFRRIINRSIMGR